MTAEISVKLYSETIKFVSKPRWKSYFDGVLMNICNTKNKLGRKGTCTIDLALLASSPSSRASMCSCLCLNLCRWAEQGLKARYCPLSIACCDLLAAIFVMLRILRLLFVARIELFNNNGRLAPVKTKTTTEAREAMANGQYWAFKAGFH